MRPTGFFIRLLRDDLIGGELLRVADRLGGNSMTPLLTCLVETGELSARTAHLRQLLDELAPKRVRHVLLRRLRK